MNQDIDLPNGFLFLRLLLGQFEEEKVARIEDEEISPLRCQPLDQCGLLGDPAKGIFVSAAGLNFSLDVVGVNDGEGIFSGGLFRRGTLDYGHDKE